MTVYYQPEVRINFESALEAISNSMPPTVDEKCQHCGLITRHPIIARQRDLERFEKIMTVAQAVLDRHGVTAKLLSELHTDIAIANAMKETK